MSTTLDRVTGSSVRFPWRSLAAVLILTASFSVWLAWNALRSYHLNVATQQRQLRLEELRGVILRLDEVLTMSAQMSAATGERQWEDRYHQFEPPLDAAIKEAMRLEPHEVIARSAAQTDAANAKLVAMEHGAFELVRQGQPKEARVILSSEEYQRQKQAYSSGMSEFMVLLVNHMEATQASEWREARMTVFGVLAGLGLTFWMWVLVIRSLRRWRRTLVKAIEDRTQTEVALRHSQEQLEERVRQRTAALQQSEERYRLLFDSASDAIMTLDANGFLDCNPATLNMFGCQNKDEFIGLHPSDISPPHQASGLDSRTAADQKIAEAFQKGTSQFEWIHRRCNGEDFPVEVWLTVFRLEERTILQAAVRDITVRKRVEQTLKEAEEKFRTMFNAARDGILVADLTTKQFIFANPGICHLTGYSEPELLRMGVGGLHPEPDLPYVIEQFDKQAKGEIQVASNIPILRKDRSVTMCDVNSTPIKIGGKEVLLGFFHDITERRRMEAEVAKARDVALEGTRLKAEFLANMSHEIRTPMNGVIGMANLLLDTELTPQQRHFANTIGKSGESLLNLINDILDFSKIEARKLEFEMLDFDLREAVEDALDLVAERAGAKHLELAVSVPSDVPTQLRGDPGRLRQILLNLVNNAIKFTERGEVIVRVALVSQTATHARLRWEVKDTGMGISPEDQTRLFQAFSQADNSTTRKFGGTGLGLAISKQLAELMGGQIGVESEPGKGATFWFTAELEKRVVETPSSVAAKPDLANVQVLIADDNAAIREILERQMQTSKIRSRSAANPTEALQLLREASADRCQIALLDAGMPGMDGLSLARAIKADPAIASTRLILLISFGQKLDSAKITAAGIDACLTKPVKQSLLLDCLATVMGRAAPRVAGLLVPSTPESHPVPALRLLLAEDNVVNQEVAAGQLRRLGYQADVVANGLEALAALQRVPYDAILMDCQMPEMDGYEATRSIRSRERSEERKSVWIIAMTASAMPEDREVCLAAGMNDFISKPVRDVELQKALDRCESALGKATASVTSPLSAALPFSDSRVSAGPSVPAVAAERPAVDLERLHEVSEGGLEGLRELIELYLTQADRLMSGLKTAIKAAATNEVHQLAHELRGSSAACGMRAILAPLQELERQGERGRLTDADQLFARANRQLKSIRRLLADHLLSLQPHSSASPS